MGYLGLSSATVTFKSLTFDNRATLEKAIEESANAGEAAPTAENNLHRSKAIAHILSRLKFADRQILLTGYVADIFQEAA